MVLRFSDGFDDYSEENWLSMQYNRQWEFVTNGSATITPVAAAGKYGGVGLKLVNSATLAIARQNHWRGATPTYNISVVALWFKTATAQTPSANHTIFALQETGSTPYPGAQLQNQVNIGVTTTGVLGISKFGQTTDNNFTAGTGSTNICDGNWHHITVAIRAISGINGVALGRVDGSAEITFTGGSMLNISTGFQPLDKIAIVNHNRQQTDYYIDDLFMYDDINAVVTGDIDYDTHWPIDNHRIETLRPSAAGTNADFTATGAADNYACVDELTNDYDTTYLSSSTTGHTDSYAFDNLTGTVTTIEGVAMNVCSRQASAGSVQYKAFALSGGTEGTYATKTYPTSFESPHQYNVMPTDPDTSAAWTESGINAAEFGIETQ